MINTTYEMDQTVWFVDFKEKEYKCPVCHGKGITEANVAKKIYTVKCPECYGWKHLWKKTYMVKAVKIEGIEAKVISKTSWIVTYRLSNAEYLYEEVKDGQKHFYTAIEQSKVFASKKEAMAYAKTANKQAKAEREEEKKNDAKRDLAEQEAMYDEHDD